MISLCALAVLTAFNGMSSSVQRSTAHVCVCVCIYNLEFSDKEECGFPLVSDSKTDDVSREIVK